MITRCYSIFDRKSLVFHAPWFQPTDGAATRVLEDLVNDNTTSIGKHPSDYVLFFVGTYDDQKGAMAPVSPLVHIMDAIALVRGTLQPDMFQQPAGNGLLAS